MHQIYRPSQARRNWVTLTGRDAEDFLHRLTTVHVRALEVGQGAPGFFLSAQGKVRAFFTLWRFGQEDYAFELDPGEGGQWKSGLLSVIDQYTFAEKITVTDVSALASGWIFPGRGQEKELLDAMGAPGLRPEHTLAIDEEIRLCHHGEAQLGRPWITAWGRPMRLSQWMERVFPPGAAGDATEREIEGWRIRAMGPRMDAEITADTIPLETGLLGAISQNKGCYPGQEVIERIISQGSPPRRLALIEGEGQPPPVGEAVFNVAEPPAQVGQITSATASPDAPGCFSALAFLRKIHAKEGLEVRLGAQSAPGRAVVRRIAPYAEPSSASLGRRI